MLCSAESCVLVLCSVESCVDVLCSGRRCVLMLCSVDPRVCCIIAARCGHQARPCAAGCDEVHRARLQNSAPMPIHTLAHALIEVVATSSGREAGQHTHAMGRGAEQTPPLRVVVRISGEGPNRASDKEGRILACF